MKKSIVAIIQARFGSTRLPGKVLLQLGGKTILENVYERVSRSRFIDDVVIATTINTQDNKIVKLCQEKNISYFRGSEENVLDRYYKTAKKYRADYIIRITSDCPLIDYNIINKVITTHFKEKNDYTANAYIETYPDGEDIEIFSFKVLREAWKNANRPSEFEHATQYITNNPEKYKIGNVAYTKDLSSKRWVLDEKNDYIFLQAIYEALGKKNKYFGMEEILQYLRKHPELEKINHYTVRNEGLLSSLEEDHLIQKKGEKMGRGQQLYEKAKKIIPGGTQLLSKRPELHLPDLWPPYYQKAKGCEIWDLEGKRYIDMSYMGIGACVLGYADADVDNAVKKAIDMGVATTLNSPKEIELAQMLLRLHPWAGMARFACGGGEGMVIATRIARAKSGRDKVLFCGYHGWHDWYLSSNLANDKALDGHLLPGLRPKGVPRVLKGTTIPFAYNDTQAFMKLIKKYKGEIGAVVIEPIRSIYPEKGFLETIRKETKKNNIVLVADEVSLGFRLTCGGSHLKLGFEPDIAVFSKALGNGYPIAAIIGKKEVMDAAQESFISSTNWTGNVGLTAAIATIRKYKKNHVEKHLDTIGKTVKDGWSKFANKHNLNIHISGTNAIGHFDFQYDNPLVLKTLFTQLMLEKGFLATNAFYCSFAHKQADIKKYLSAVDVVFGKIASYILSGNPEQYIKKSVCQAGFRRLN